MKTTFRLLLDPDDRLDIDHAFRLLNELFPLVKINGDTFERKRKKLESQLAQFSAEGAPIRNPELFRQELARNEKESGPGIDVTIIVSQVVQISGSILSGGISLLSYDQLGADVIQRVEGYLKAFDIGKIVVIQSE